MDAKVVRLQKGGNIALFDFFGSLQTNFHDGKGIVLLYNHPMKVITEVNWVDPETYVGSFNVPKDEGRRILENYRGYQTSDLRSKDFLHNINYSIKENLHLEPQKGYLFYGRVQSIDEATFSDLIKERLNQEDVQILRQPVQEENFDKQLCYTQRLMDVYYLSYPVVDIKSFYFSDDLVDKAANPLMDIYERTNVFRGMFERSSFRRNLI